jgi:hypothetical protein
MVSLHVPHFHAPHVPESYSLFGVVVGVALIPLAFFATLFAIVKAFAG